VRDVAQNIVVVSGPRGDEGGPVRAIRAFVGGSLVAVVGGIAILLVGAPIAFLVRLLHDLVAWIAGR
jgi:hypothetical protein